MTATDVAEADAGPVLAYSFRPGFPNPFRASTSISYSLPRREHVRIQVYDVNGRLVRSLVDEERGAQAHVATWDGRDSGGREVSSGVYFIRFEAGAKVFTQRSVVLR